jgi:hypothetical protein
MSTTTTTFEQTYEQAAKFIKDFTDLATNFTDGVMKGIERGGQDAATALIEVRGQYQRSINAAIILREAARASGDRVAEEVFRTFADEAAQKAFALADDSKTVMQRVELFNSFVRSGVLSAGGKAVGPLWDSGQVGFAIYSGDGNKAGEAGLSIFLAMAGGAVGLKIAAARSVTGLWSLAAGGVGAVLGNVLNMRVKSQHCSLR